MHNKHPLFPLGGLYCTQGALAALEEAKTFAEPFLVRHITGDWSEMDEEDQQTNREAVVMGNRIFSAYHLSTGVELWIITDADRSATTLLLPSEY